MTRDKALLIITICVMLSIFFIVSIAFAGQQDIEEPKNEVEMVAESINDIPYKVPKRTVEEISKENKELLTNISATIANVATQGKQDIEERLEAERKALEAQQIEEAREEETKAAEVSETASNGDWSSGSASAYSIACNTGGTATASGIPLDDVSYTCAVPTSQSNLLGGQVQISYGGQTITATITDTGGFGSYGRALDLSLGCITAFGFSSTDAWGVREVSYKFL